MNGKITLSNKLKGAVTMANTIINGGASPYPKGASGDIITITDGAENTPLKSAVVNIEPAQDLHGYDYPWPVGGGKNKLNVSSGSGTEMRGVNVTYDNAGGLTYSGTTTVNGFIGNWTLSPALTLPAGTYTFSIGEAIAQRIDLLAGWTSVGYINANNTSSTFTLSEAKTVDKIVLCANAAGMTININAKKIQIESGSTATSYSPYSNICPITGWSDVEINHSGADTSDPETVIVSLGQTVYGGTLDVVRGKLTITRKTITLDGSQNILASNNNRFYFNIGEAFRVTVTNQVTYAGVTSDRMKPMSWADLSYNYTVRDSACCGPVYGNGIAFGWNNITTVADWKTYFTNNPTQFTYELATPIEVDLTPQSVKTLLGVNNIWADAGEMSIEYYPAAASIVAVQNRSTKAYVSIPLGMIRYETYQITPQQTIDLDSYRSENGNLLRNPVATKCKLEFNTPLMTDTQWGEIWNIIKAGFNNGTERKLKLKYYDTLSATYKTGYFYVPDVQTTIRNIDEATGTINYNEIRLAFIEY